MKTCPPRPALAHPACALLAPPRPAAALLAALALLLSACGGAPAPEKPCPAGQTCTAPVYFACFGTNQVVGAARDLQPAGVARDVGQGPTSLALAGDDLWVGSSLGGAEVDRITGGGAPSRFTFAGGDLEYLRVHQGRVYVSNANVGTVTVLDAGTGGVVGEVSMVDRATTFPNPRNVDFVGDRAYVALPGPSGVGSASAATQEIAVVDFSTTPGQVVKRISMQPIASQVEGLPFPYRLLAAGTKIYVVLANLKPGAGPLSGFYTEPAGDGRLAVIDTATNELSPALVDLGSACGNPSGVALDGGTLWISCNTGAVVPVTITIGAPSVGAPIPTPAGMSPGNLSVCRGTGYVTDLFSGKVARFDAAARTMSDPVEMCPLPQGVPFTFAADVACQP